MNNQIVLENKKFSLTINPDCSLESLIYKSLNEECLYQGEKFSAFAITEERPYNNEIKLAYPNKKLTFQGNRIRKEDNKLIIGFELVLFEAVVEYDITDDYITFSLCDFIVPPTAFGSHALVTPPVYSFRLLQLPVTDRTNFGEWLNVMWDDKIAVNLLANAPHTIIDAEKRNGYHIFTAETYRDIKLKNSSASLIVTDTSNLLDSIDKLEHDYDLPKGVESRLRAETYRSIYWSPYVYPENVDEHIAYAKKGGFKMMMLYYTSVTRQTKGYETCGDYTLNEHYPNGISDVVAMLDKIKAAGITPGLHFLHPHIGLDTKYISPVADRRLNISRYFTLSRDIGTDDTTIYVDQNPTGAILHERASILNFGGELIHYESYSAEYPYCFKGCTRGFRNTNIIPHSLGTIGGILDISEYGAESVHIDQKTDLQDEVADEIAKVYDAGFEFLYYDGSEGTQPPFEFNVPNSQYRVYKKLGKAPLFCEGAAKSHFSWHILSGGNAFDIFPPAVFKKSIVKYPFEQAGRMKNDFTRVNFGWWSFMPDTQADIYEYGASRAAAWNAPITIQAYPEKFVAHNRTDDIFEVLRRWSDARDNHFFTPKQLEALKNPDQEHTLLINEKGEYELVPYTQIENAAKGSGEIRAFVFERNDRNYVVYWHSTDSAKIALKLDADKLILEEDIGKGSLEITKDGDSVILAADNKKYLSSTLSREELIAAFENATIL